MRIYRAAYGQPKNIPPFSVSSAFFSTELIVDQISSSGMFVMIVFLGDNLEEVVEHMDRTTAESGQNSYLVLHYHPTTLTVKYDFTEVQFEPCSDPLRVTTITPACVYNNNRAAKVGMFCYIGLIVG